MLLRAVSYLLGHHLRFIILVLEAMFDECVFTQPSDGSLVCIHMYLGKIET